MSAPSPPPGVALPTSEAAWEILTEFTHGDGGGCRVGQEIPVNKRHRIPRRLLGGTRHLPQFPHPGFHLFGHVAEHLQAELVQAFEMPVKRIRIQTRLTGKLPQTQRRQATGLGNQPQRRLYQFEFSAGY